MGSCFAASATHAIVEMTVPMLSSPLMAKNTSVFYEMRYISDEHYSLAAKQVLDSSYEYLFCGTVAL